MKTNSNVRYSFGSKEITVMPAVKPITTANVIEIKYLKHGMPWAEVEPNLNYGAVQIILDVL